MDDDWSGQYMVDAWNGRIDNLPLVKYAESIIHTIQNIDSELQKNKPLNEVQVGQNELSVQDYLNRQIIFFNTKVLFFCTEFCKDIGVCTDKAAGPIMNTEHYNHPKILSRPRRPLLPHNLAHEVKPNIVEIFLKMCTLCLKLNKIYYNLVVKATIECFRNGNTE